MLSARFTDGKGEKGPAWSEEIHDEAHAIAYLKSKILTTTGSSYEEILLFALR